MTVHVQVTYMQLEVFDVQAVRSWNAVNPPCGHVDFEMQKVKLIQQKICDILATIWG